MTVSKNSPVQLMWECDKLSHPLDIRNGGRDNANKQIILLYYTRPDISSGHGIKGRSLILSFAVCAVAMPLLV